MTRVRYVLLAVAIVASTAAPARAQWALTPYLGANVAGDAEFRRGGPGVSLAYPGRRLGFEFDLQRYQHFFKDSEIVPLDPAAPPNCRPGVRGACTDINTDAIGFMGNAVVPLRIRGASKWSPYGSVGAGLIRAWTNEAGRHQNDFAWNVGGGTTFLVSRRVALRGDVRYFRALVDEHKTTAVLPRDYDFVRVAFGVTIGLSR